MTVSAKHPTSRDQVTAEIEVISPPTDEPISVPPGSVRIVTDAPLPLELPKDVVFTAWRVEAIIDGQPQDVTEDSLITIDGESASTVVSLNGRAIKGVSPGDVTLRATFNGESADNSLAIHVVEKLDLDAIVVQPASLTLAINENTRLEAIGMRDGRRVGAVTDHPAITWTSSNPDVVTAGGPLLTALSKGTAGITAGMQGVKSQPAQIRVLGADDPAPVESLTLTPSSITMRPGESVKIGRDIRVFRGNADMGLQAEVSPANVDIVSFDQSNRMLKAGLPGHSRVTVIVGTQTANLDVTVLNDPPNAAGGLVLIEPPSGLIAVGEQLPVQVYLHAKDGKRYNVTNSAVLATDNPMVAKMSGTAVLGVAPGA